MNLITYENIEIISSPGREAILSKVGGQPEYTTLFGMAFHKNSFNARNFINSKGNWCHIFFR